MTVDSYLVHDEVAVHDDAGPAGNSRELPGVIMA